MVEGRRGLWGLETGFSLAALGCPPPWVASCTGPAATPILGVVSWPSLMGGVWSISSILASHLLSDLEQVARLLCDPVSSRERS